MKKEELATMLGAQATPVEIAQSRLSTTTFNCNQKMTETLEALLNA